MNSIVTWALAFMTVQSPIARHTDETPDEVNARFQSIAEDLAEVVFDPQEAPVYTGPRGRIQTLSLMESIALYESGFRKNVDTGEGPRSRGDAGRSVCLMQIQVGMGKTKPYNRAQGRFARDSDLDAEVEQGYTAPDLLADRKKCFRVALHMVQQSFTACSGLPISNRLAVYASGSCDGGWYESQKRVSTGQRWFDAHVPTFTDVNAMDDNTHLVQE